MKTRITELFGIEHPIMLAGMSGLSLPELVAAACNAGGMGILAIAPLTPEEARRAIRETKELTDKPFAVNQVLISPRAKANVSVAIEEKVPVLNYTLGRPADVAPLIKAVHDYGGKVMGTVALVRHAMRAEQLGVDAVQITGHEAAAHGARATSLVLTPLVAKSIKVPISAAGGFYDGRGLAAALALGADGITMGTRFAMTKECVLHEHWKQVILKATEQDTLYLEHDLPSRVLKTKKAEDEMKGGMPLMSAVAGALDTKRMLKLSWWEFIRAGLGVRKAGVEVEGMEGLGALEQMRNAASSVRSHRTILDGDENAGILPVGQIIGGIDDIPTVAEVIEQTVAEAEQALETIRQKVHA